MTTNKLIRVSKQHAERMYQIVLEKYNQDKKKWLKKQKGAK